LKIPSGSFSSFETIVQPLTQAPEIPVRQSWIDYAKALAIVLVVFGHASRSVGRTDGLVWGEDLRLADALIYSFHIPLFFVLAGVTAGLQRGRSVGGQLRGLYWGIVVPYVIWTAAWVGLKISFPQAVNHPLGGWDLLGALWQPVEHMWFLQHLIIARLFWLAFERTGATGASSSAGSALIAAFLTAGMLLTPLGGPWSTIGPILINAAFVGVGFVWVPLLLHWRESRWLLVAALVVGVIWFSVTAGLRPPDSGATGILVALAGSFTALVLIWRLRGPASVFGRAAAFIGEASLAIFVIHSIVIGLTRKVLSQIGGLDEPTLIIAGTTLGVLIPAALFWLAITLSARTGVPLVRWLGFGTATRSHYFSLGSPQLVPHRAAPIRF